MKHTTEPGQSPAWRLQRTEQCAKCPWKAGSNPNKIPNGYNRRKHEALECTIAKEAGFTAGPLRVMGCHEDHEAHCIGWLVNQLGPGNNISLRLSIRRCENIREVKTHGKQHERFKDTLKRKSK